MDVDNLLVNYIGEIGRFQILLLLFGCSVTFNNSFSSIDYVFTGATPSFRCDIGKVSNNLQNLSFDELSKVSSPQAKDNKVDACWIRDFNYSLLTDSEAKEIIAGNTNASVQKCQKWVYSKEEFTETIVSQVSQETVISIRDISPCTENAR